MKALKTIAKVVLTTTACLSFVMIFAQADTIGNQLISTLGSLGVLYLSAKGLDRMGALNEEER